jgi:hypothetical protein
MEKLLVSSPQALQQLPARPIQTSPAANSRSKFVNFVPSLVLAPNKVQASRVHPDRTVTDQSKLPLLMPIGRWVKVKHRLDKSLPVPKRTVR